MKQVTITLIFSALVATLIVWGVNAIMHHREIVRIEQTLENFRADQQSATDAWNEAKGSIAVSEEEYLWMEGYADYYACKAGDMLCKKFDCTSPFADELDGKLKRLGALEYNIIIDDTLQKYADIYGRKIVNDMAVKVMERILEVKSNKKKD